MLQDHLGIAIPRNYFLLLLLLAFAISACDAYEDDDEYEYVDLENVPQAVLDAAREAVPGLVVYRVERESKRNGGT